MSKWIVFSSSKSTLLYFGKKDKLITYGLIFFKFRFVCSDTRVSIYLTLTFKKKWARLLLWHIRYSYSINNDNNYHCNKSIIVILHGWWLWRVTPRLTQSYQSVSILDVVNHHLFWIKIRSSLSSFGREVCSDLVCLW